MLFSDENELGLTPSTFPLDRPSLLLAVEWLAKFHAIGIHYKHRNTETLHTDTHIYVDTLHVDTLYTDILHTDTLYTDILHTDTLYTDTLHTDTQYTTQIHYTQIHYT